MELIMANGQMGISSFEGTRTLSSKYSINPSLLQGFAKISLNPISGIAFKREKLKKNRIFSAIAPDLVDSGRVIEKQFEFQPAFDEYLKALESVKTGRERKPVKDANFRENLMGKDDERIESGNEGERSSEKSRLWVRQKGVNNRKLGFGESGTNGATKTGRERKPVKDANIRENLIGKDEERMESGNEGEGSSEKSHSWTRQKGADNRKLGFGENGNGAPRSTSNLDLRERFSRKGRVGSIWDSSGRGRIGLGEKSNGVMKGSSMLGGREGFFKKDGVENTRGSDHRKFEYRENDMDLSNERRLEEDEVNGSFNKTNQRWMKGDNSKFDATERTPMDQRLHGTYRRSNAVKRLGSDEDLHGGGLDQRKYTNMQKKPPNSNETRVATQIRNTERATDFTGISKWVPERQQSHRSGIGSKTSESSLDRTLSDWKRISKSDGELELGETESGKNTYIKELSHRSKFEKRIYDSDTIIRNKSESSYGNQSNIRPNSNMFETEKLGFRSTKTHVELGRDHSYTEDTRHKVSLKSGNFSRSSNFLKEGVGENDMDMERAAFKSFEVFTDLRGQPRVLRMEMEERIQNLAKWLNGTDINLPEWLFSKMIHSARIRFSDHSILRVIQILGTLGNWRRVLQVIEWLQSRERFKSYKTRYIYTAALDVLGKAKRPVEALNVFHAMREGVSSYPDLAAYHCIAVALGQAGYVKELFDVIDCMRSPPPNKFKTGLNEKWDPRLEPDIIVYNAVLNACARRKQWEGAFWVLQQLKEQGLQPSSTTYGLAMEVMLACEKYNLVYEFFKKVEKFTIPNSLNYKVLVNSLWKEGKTDDAVFAVKDMERRGIVGSASLYYDLARCLCSAGRCQEALMQMDKICKVAHKPLVVTYTGLIQACLDKGNVQDGSYIFKQMQEFCSPNLVTCNIMLKGYLEHKVFEDAKELFQKMVDDSCQITRRSDYKTIVTPDSYTFNAMLDACAAEQKWEDFRYVFQEMLRQGYNFNTKRHLGMILQACRAGEGELLETTWKHLVQYTRVPPPPIVKERFCIKLEKNDYTAAISSITTHPISDLRLHAFSEKGWLDLLNANTHRFQKDTIVRLTHKLNSLVAGTDQPHPMIQNLLSSCREFIRTHYTAAGINTSEMREQIYQT